MNDSSSSSSSSSKSRVISRVVSPNIKKEMTSPKAVTRISKGTFITTIISSLL